MSALYPSAGTEPLAADELSAYLTRIGVDGTAHEPDLGTLRLLVAAHAATIPFETLDPARGREPDLSGPALVAKLVHGRRGGWCYEQNGLLRRALDALGFHTATLTARVRWGEPDDAPTTARTHMLLQVDLPDGPHVADVGFGGLVPTAPLRLEHGTVQDTPLGRYRLVLGPAEAGPSDGGPGTWTLHALVGDTWRTLYTFDPTAAAQIDVETGNFYLSHHPDSPFRGAVSASLSGADGRTNLSGGTLTLRHRDGRHERTELTSPAQVRDVLEDRFGIDTAGLDGLDGLLSSIVGPESSQD